MNQLKLVKRYTKNTVTVRIYETELLQATKLRITHDPNNHGFDAYSVSMSWFERVPRYVTEEVKCSTWSTAIEEMKNQVRATLEG